MADGVDHLERAALPVEAKLHGIVDILRRGCDFRHETGGIGQHPRQHTAAETGAIIIAGDDFKKRLAPRGSRVGGAHGGIGERLVTSARCFQGFAGTAQRTGQFGPVITCHVETAKAFVAGIAVGDHCADHLVLAANGVEGVTFGKDAAKRGDDIDHQVDPDQVIEAEHARLRNAHGAAHQRIGLLDCQLVAHGLVDPGLQREHADPVAEEARRIGTAHHAFAKDPVVEIGQPVDHRLVCIGAADKLQKAHIAHRIEIMGDGEPLAESGRHILDQKADRDGRGVGADNAVRPDGGVKPRIEVLLDVEPLDNRLDDPVAFGELAKIVADRAGDDAAGIALVHQLRRIRCHQPVDCHLGG